MLNNCSKKFHDYFHRLGIFIRNDHNIQNCIEVNHENLVMYVSNIGHHVISQPIKSEIII
jgi:hypothetical protein